MNITLTGELENLVKNKVDSGMYTDASEVIREALRLLNEDPTHDLKKFLLSRISESEEDELEVKFDQLITEAKSEIKK
jgi:antitoxin ParD1/3/4